MDAFCLCFISVFAVDKNPNTPNWRSMDDDAILGGRPVGGTLLNKPLIGVCVFLAEFRVL